MTESIGERLHRLRLERGLSQRQLADTGVTAAYISRIEGGERRPSVRALRQLAPKLGVSVMYLETGSDLTDSELRDIRLGDAELRLRLGEGGAEVETELRALLDEAREASDDAGALRAQIALGLAAAARSDHAEAVQLLEAVVAHSGISPLGQPDVYAALGHAYSELGRRGDAIRLFEDCLASLDESDPRAEAAYVRFATFLSYALADAGDLGAAQSVVNEAIDRAGTVDDAYSRVRLYWSRARLASMAGESTSALSNIRSAITLLKETEDTLHLGLAYLLQGEFLLEENRLDEADAVLALASRLVGQADVQHRGGLLAEQAKVAARRGDAKSALALAEEAILVVGSGTPSEEGRAHWALAEALAAAGDLVAAEQEFDRAEQLLAGEERYTVQLLKIRARVAREAGRVDQAIELLERATELAARRFVSSPRAVRGAL